MEVVNFVGGIEVDDLDHEGRVRVVVREHRQTPEEQAKWGDSGVWSGSLKDALNLHKLLGRVIDRGISIEKTLEEDSARNR